MEKTSSKLSYNFHYISIRANHYRRWILWRLDNRFNLFQKISNVTKLSGILYRDDNRFKLNRASPTGSIDRHINDGFSRFRRSRESMWTPKILYWSTVQQYIRYNEWIDKNIDIIKQLKLKG